MKSEQRRKVFADSTSMAMVTLTLVTCVSCIAEYTSCSEEGHQTWMQGQRGGGASTTASQAA